MVFSNLRSAVAVHVLSVVSNVPSGHFLNDILTQIQITFQVELLYIMMLIKPAIVTLSTHHNNYCKNNKTETSRNACNISMIC